MPIDFRNTNTIWASILAETLKRLGLTHCVVSPGSRSTPLAVAFSQQEEIETIPVLDERSAAFFALGIARHYGRAVALICTSGTAGANLYPGVIEARQSRVPLLVLTADRPAEMRDCSSGQTIDQLKLYGNYPNWQAELAVPSVEISMLRCLRQTVVHAWERSRFPICGPVHLNIPFRDPLAPVPQLDTDVLPPLFELEDFFAGIAPTPDWPLTPIPTFEKRESADGENILWWDNNRVRKQQTLTPYQEWRQSERGIIIAGPAQPHHPREYCQAVGKLSQVLGWPVLAEGLSPLRNHLQINPYLISTYDLILRNHQLAQQLKPSVAIHLGELPISKILRTWLDESQPRRWVIDPCQYNLDPLHGKTTHLRTSIEELVQLIPAPSIHLLGAGKSSVYLRQWCEAEAKVRSAVDQKMSSMTQLFEGKAAWLLSQSLPVGTPLFVANSMPVRDVEFFSVPNNNGVKPFFNRGANGIDGNLSTALGIAYRNQSSVMLAGDLAVLHDTNGFLLNNKFTGHLTIVLINNRGGGIFEMLPISQFDPPFEELFAMPQAVNFASLCLAYGVEHQLIHSWQQLKQLLNPLPSSGIRVLELPTNRRADASWRREYLGKFASDLKV
ncbi:MAG: 2-succinyl-5-enolpyruvyl-6-hydroxy-3-cyclohexene-1-carboxylic-acid synthase [Coleofasciculaceae cyanobacterium]